MQTQPGVSSVDALVSVTLQRLRSCPYCHEVFEGKHVWYEHVRQVHAEKLAAIGKKAVTLHHVEEGAQQIYICPHDHYAVSTGGYTSAYTDITLHLEKDLPEHPRVVPRPITFFVSSDQQLIAAYHRNEAEIEIWQCSAGCQKTFANCETLLAHIWDKHSKASLQDLPADRSRFLKEQAEIIVQARQPRPPRPGVQLPREPRPSAIALPSPIAQLDIVVPPCPSLSPEPTIPARPSPEPEIPVGTLFLRTADLPQINAGRLRLPSRLRCFLAYSRRVTVQFRRDWQEILQFDGETGYLAGMAEWYRINAIEPGDQMKIRLADDATTMIEIWTEWEKHENYVFRCPPEDFRWRDLSIRDCLLRVLHEGDRPMHYRELYAQISKHRDLQVGSVIGVLSKYREVLFQHVNRGQWILLPVDQRRLRVPRIEGLPRPLADDRPVDWQRIWGIVEEIEKNDIVYKLLQRTRRDMSFDQICMNIAEWSGVDWHALSRTGFLDVHDPRLRRLSNGNFALEEWFVPPVTAQPLTHAPDADEAGAKDADKEPMQSTDLVLLESPQLLATTAVNNDSNAPAGKPDISPSHKKRKVRRGRVERFWRYCRRLLMWVVFGIRRK
ncbi:MAG: hypothetical protein IT445_01095 [Phycisphaeraceae bacterium]|nr:hypothetical protein [Phycisphaeraceae bacterium]